MTVPNPDRMQQALQEQRIWLDYRKDVLRWGPAPYVSEEQLTL